MPRCIVQYVAMRYAITAELHRISIIRNFEYSPVDIGPTIGEKAFNIVAICGSATVITPDVADWGDAIQAPQIHLSYCG